MVKCHIPEMLSDLAFLGNPTYQWWFFNFLRISVKKQSYRDSKLKRHFGLKMEYPIPTYSKNDHSHHVQYFICFFLQGVGKTQKPKTKVRASERPSVSRGWLQWLVYFLFLKIIALGASSLADFFTLRKCPLDSTLARGCTIFVDWKGMNLVKNSILLMIIRYHKCHVHMILYKYV
jgi:hypothetical protein